MNGTILLITNNQKFLNGTENVITSALEVFN